MVLQDNDSSAASISFDQTDLEALSTNRNDVDNVPNEKDKSIHWDDFFDDEEYDDTREEYNDEDLVLTDDEIDVESSDGEEYLNDNEFD
ncbi:hypothetical protein PanWU01x14_209610 [Parasponia andersonii]|uniref:Uncharacterized protein n=1 Tax=Parasponia andersonii TaxID=3476 RepID=A0A2P5BUG0_PARAD|nr:hypothetical protein PanWU01x14_209610 [Parasponia andersonii]